MDIVWGFSQVCIIQTVSFAPGHSFCRVDSLVILSAVVKSSSQTFFNPLVHEKTVPQYP